ncbi:MAG: hypothetical protein OXF09_05620 [Hyphomicrobiales bacterium]|nr:hypothetical protein [Hyphomicrobiales bacterium]
MGVSPFWIGGVMPVEVKKVKVDDSTKGNMTHFKAKENCYFLDSAMHCAHSLKAL